MTENGQLKPDGCHLLFERYLRVSPSTESSRSALSQRDV